MNFVESRLLGVRINESGRDVFLSIKEKTGAKFDIKLHGVEKLSVSEMRQHNIIEDAIHWTAGKSNNALQEAAFFLMAGTSERDCNVELVKVALNTVNRVVKGELEMIEITAIFGAQVIASFASMTILPTP